MRIREIPSSATSLAASNPASVRRHEPMDSSDDELVRRFQGGDESAFEAVVARWNAPLYQLAYRLTGDLHAAQDVRQMALIQTYRGLGSFQGRSRLSTWLYRVVLNLCRDRRRGRTAREDAQAGMGEVRARERAHEPPADRHTIQAEIAERVSAAVLSLPPREREVVVLRHYHDLSFPAIAEVVGAPVTTVKSRMTKGLERLRGRLAVLEES